MTHNRKKNNLQEPNLFDELSDAIPPSSTDTALHAMAPTRTAPLINPDLPLAEIAVVGPLRGTYTYLLKDNERLVPGTRVRVPFGGRVVEGYYLGPRSVHDLYQDGVDIRKLKPILSVLESGGEILFTPKLLELARWIARHYVCPLGTTLSAMLPAGVKRGSSGARVRFVTALKNPAECMAEAAKLLAKKPKQAALLEALAKHNRAESINAAILLQQASASDSALKALEKAGLLRISEQRLVNPLDSLEQTDLTQNSDLLLSTEQQTALSAIQTALDLGIYTGFLLQGVTGSGKTEVYLRGLKYALEKGKQGIVLVPEIALTPQTAQRFEQRLGKQRVAVLHSHVTDGERAEAWRAIRHGLIDVVVGARSALFAPLPRLGFIVIDEEHESAFKQESTPRYHTRDVSMELARASNAVLVLGSATPSLETLYAAKKGALKHIQLTQRVGGGVMPPVEIIDLTRENEEAQRYSYLSRKLVAALHEILARKEQAILFMNRRGFATVITCLRCGHTEKCEQCDITLTSHRAGTRPTSARLDTAALAPSLAAHSDLLVCHYCNFSKAIPDVCNGCGAPGVKHWGLGTERVESEVRKLFPTARVARMDSDTMTHRTAYLDTLGQFRAGKLDILVGTQMIAKGLDFPNVTLVGVILADTALHMPDFRSRERTFQLLAQVAGRAGRGEKGGKVVVQTYLPGDSAIKAAARHDFETFSLNELKERHAFSYPPFTRLARIVVSGKDPQATRSAAERIVEVLRTAISTQTTAAADRNDVAASCTLLGPSEPPISKLEGRYRQHILLKASDSELISTLLSGGVSEALSKLRGADATVDVDPLAML